MQWTLEDMIRILDIQGTDAHGPVTGISLDTRSLKPGQLFVALRGGHTDGHDYVAQAFRQGACAAIVASSFAGNTGLPQNTGPLLAVEDPLTALQVLAAHAREAFRGTVIAVTGTNGKTTTREMIARVLSQSYRVHRTAGNLNNHIGVPLSILDCPGDAEIMVLEMGMNHHGEIRRLCEIARPDMGVITNVGRGHLAFFKDVADVARAKAELLESLSGHGTAFVNGDDVHLQPYHGSAFSTVLYGFGEHCDVQAVPRPSEIGPALSFENILIVLRIPGQVQLYNALAAIAVGRAFQVPTEAMKSALESFQACDMRMQVMTVCSMKIINDVYNANPDSMIAAVRTLTGMKTVSRRIAILGDMLELGTTSVQEHQKLGAWLAGQSVDLFAGVGPGMQRAVESALEAGHEDARAYPDVESILADIDGLTEPGDTVLVKGSRGMHMETVVDALKTCVHCVE
ncbi:UDP-N-acetylmuramoyl-tripeptide--D-alanyl-D-alanine ligase [bacterium]|nr:UDP-N-acetylmuramoyl-tripeptide--D-alanyl-D-alanine ligase [bacterium]